MYILWNNRCMPNPPPNNNEIELPRTINVVHHAFITIGNFLTPFYPMNKLTKILFSKYI